MPEAVQPVPRDEIHCRILKLIDKGLVKAGHCIGVAPYYLTHKA